MHSGRRTVQQSVTCEKDLSRVLGGHQLRSNEHKIEGKGVCEASQSRDVYQTATRGNLKELAFSTQSTFERSKETILGGVKDKLETSQNESQYSKLTGSIESAKENKTPPKSKEGKYHQERVRIYHKEKLISQEQWASYIFGELEED